MQQDVSVSIDALEAVEKAIKRFWPGWNCNPKVSIDTPIGKDQKIRRFD